VAGKKDVPGKPVGRPLDEAMTIYFGCMRSEADRRLTWRSQVLLLLESGVLKMSLLEDCTIGVTIFP
jgi:hypothetical protein